MQCRAIPYEGNEPYIFLSYSHKDAEQVYPILEQMARQGYRIWYDDGNHAGDDWLENIGQHVSNCTICIAMLSGNAEASHNCKKEVNFAVQCNKKLVAVMLERFAMTVGMRLQLSTIHYLEKEKYPSTAMLLQKIYETEGMQQCLSAPGSIRLRSVSVPETKIKATEVLQNPLSQFIGSEINKKPRESTDAEVAPANTELHTKRVQKRQVQKVQPVFHPRDSARVISPDGHQDVGPAGPVPEPLPKHEDTIVASDEKVTAVSDVSVASNAVDEEDTTLFAPVNPHTNVSTNLEASANTEMNEEAFLLRLADNSIFRIGSQPVRIGRSAKKCDFVIKGNTSISNLHAEIIFHHNTYYLLDKSSSNGSFIGEHRLSANEEILLSNLCIFRLSNEDFLLVYGEEAAHCTQAGNLTFLMNPTSKLVCLISQEALYLDRVHKWADGSLSDTKVSREHAIIEKADSNCYLRDLGSRNGTYLNEEKLSANEKRQLSDKDLIRLADTVLEFRWIQL